LLQIVLVPIYFAQANAIECECLICVNPERSRARQCEAKARLRASLTRDGDEAIQSGLH
jgi:hypothetical protein